MNEAMVPCALCAGNGLKEFFRLQGMPVLANRFYASHDEALSAAMGDIALAHCPGCGAIQNIRFDDRAVSYDEHYENSLHFSASFRAFSESLVDRLVDRGMLRGMEVVELGCGRGDFLSLLCRRAGCSGVGIDPALPDHLERISNANLRWLKRSFGELDVVTRDTRLVVCRHVLEHLARPRELLTAVADCAHRAPDLRFYFEVPNATAMLENGGVWDVIFEHPQYFTEASLSALLGSCSYEIEDIYSAFDDQYLCAEGRVASEPEHVKEPRGRVANAMHADLLPRFARSADESTSPWREFLDRKRRAGATVVLWGIGSKGVTFLNVLPDPAVITAAIDINPRKQNHFVPGTGHRIDAPTALRGIQPDAVVVSNPIYREEIESELRTLGIKADLLSI